jgi:cytochrome c-type protein NapB
MRIAIWLAMALVPLLVLGAGSVDDMKEQDDGLDLYFRENHLLALTQQAVAEYPETAAGESSLLGRDFPDAPPQIPHTIEDMYPITLDDNECLECHHPENVTSKDDLPVPESHFMRPVMRKGGPEDVMVWVVADYEKSEDLAGARYVCSMCHTPQARNVATPSNRFVTARKKQKKASD